jgi:ABC-type antimicrobial peptide transport system permease subunit
VLVSALNLLLMNIVIEKCFFPISFVLTFSIYIGIFLSFFSGELQAKHIQTVATFGFSTFIVMLFMYIQKRVHKEVFLEIRQRVS